MGDDVAIGQSFRALTRNDGGALRSGHSRPLFAPAYS